MPYYAELVAAILLGCHGEARSEVELGAHNKHWNDLAIALPFQLKHVVFLKSFNETKRGV